MAGRKRRAARDGSASSSGDACHQRRSNHPDQAIIVQDGLALALTFMSAMSSCGFAEPPTRSTLEDAHRELEKQRSALEDISAKIQSAEDELDRIVKARRTAIQEMEKERAALEDQMSQTLAYLAHIRRLPHELLGQIFMFIFEDYPCCAWVLAAVCTLWRRQVLSMPRLWSKVCLLIHHDILWPAE